ncbi:MAG: hypothetical protein HQM16_13990 [Deltaproteobacteria bacterium]|nr:hypothetical protein [Deltaproteobacteria bacterium]
MDLIKPVAGLIPTWAASIAVQVAPLQNIDLSVRDTLLPRVGRKPNGDEGTFITPHGFKYPRVILGGDKFLDYWGKQQNPELATVEGVHAVMRAAYQRGVRGFDVSMNQHVIDAYTRLRTEHADAISIGNPNWLCGVKLGDTDIYLLRDRILKTLKERCFTENHWAAIRSLPADRRQRWFEARSQQSALTPEEIADIYLDEDVFRAKLTLLEKSADYLAMGSDYSEWLFLLGRGDIVRRMFAVAGEYNMIPLSLSHWGSVTLPEFSSYPVDGHWVYINQSESLLDQDTVVRMIRESPLPVTAFWALGGGVLAGRMEAAFRYLKESGVASVVVGIERLSQVSQTMPLAVEIFK